MCQGEPGPPATLRPVPYGPTLPVSAVTAPLAPCRGGRLWSVHRGSGSQPCHRLTSQALAVRDSRAQAQEVSLR